MRLKHFLNPKTDNPPKAEHMFRLSDESINQFLYIA